jgi:CRP/FNR family transcriptional regulator
MLPPASNEALLRHAASALGSGVEPEIRINRCPVCPFRGTCVPRKVAPADLLQLEALAPTSRRVARDVPLYQADDLFTGVFTVRSGSFKSMGISRGGDLKVTGFHLPGDIIGLEGISHRRYHYSVAALEDSEVCRISHHKLIESSRTVRGLQDGLLKCISADITRDHGLLLLLGAMSAEERVVAFLLNLSGRYAALNYATDRFVLRMTRADIGSYLGLSLETVSRVLTHLADEGLIAVDRRDVLLKDLGALRARFGCW